MHATDMGRMVLWGGEREQDNSVHFIGHLTAKKQTIRHKAFNDQKYLKSPFLALKHLFFHDLSKFINQIH